jgi:hypothetical protein
MMQAKRISRIGTVRRGMRGQLTFEAEFESPPTDYDVTQAQIKAGFDPAGYGGPYDIRKMNPEGTIVRFRCASTCD